MPLDVGLGLVHALDAALFAEDRLGFCADPSRSAVVRPGARIPHPGRKAATADRARRRLSVAARLQSPAFRSRIRGS
jgi:hypothetical protein